MEQKEFSSKIQLPLFVKNAKVWLFSATIILGAEVWKKQIKPTTKQTSKCISVLPILRRIWQDWNYMYSYMYSNVYLRVFPCNMGRPYGTCYCFITGREIAPNTGANATKFFTLATKSWKLVAKLATRMFHHNLTKRYSELKRFAKINPWQTSSLSLFSKRSTRISIDNYTPSWI